MLKVRAAGDSDFDSEEDDYFDFGQETDVSALSSFHSDVPLTEPTISKAAVEIKSNCFVDALDKANIMLLSDLQNAVINGNASAVKHLITNRPHFCNTILDSGWTALIYASNFGHIVIVEVLLNSGGNVDLQGTDGCTPLMAACKCPKKQNAFKIVEDLLDRGANALLVDQSKKTALMYATRSGNEQMVRLLLEHSSSIINNKDSKGWTALDWAVSKTHENVVKLLIKDGANVVDLESHDVISMSATLKEFLRSMLLPVPQHERTTPDVVQETREKEEEVPAKNVEIKDLDISTPNSENKLVNEIKTDLVHEDEISPASVASKVATVVKEQEDKTEVENTTKDDLAVNFSLPQLTDHSEEEIAVPTGVSVDIYHKYGQMELLLCGLNLQHLIPLFQDHDMTFEQLLCASTDDLIAVGVHQVGARNRILTAIRDWHTTEWQEGSLPNFSSTALSFGNLQALLRTSSEHVLYISSALRYARSQLKTYPQVMQPPASMQLEDNPDTLVVSQVEKLTVATHKLCQSLKRLHVQAMLIKRDNEQQYQQVDFMKVERPLYGTRSKIALLSLSAVATLFVVLKCKNALIQ